MATSSSNDVMDRGLYFMKNIDFARKTAEDYLESAMFFAKRSNDQEYEYCIARASEWFGITQTWRDLAGNEKCYIVD